MIRSTSLLLGLVAMVSMACQHQQASDIEADVVFTNVNVINVKDGSILPQQDVFISGQDIVEIAPSGNWPIRKQHK